MTNQKDQKKPESKTNNISKKENKLNPIVRPLADFENLEQLDKDK